MRPAAGRQNIFSGRRLLRRYNNIDNRPRYRYIAFVKACSSKGTFRVRPRRWSKCGSRGRVSQTAPGRPRVTARPARRPVSAERGRLRQVAEGNARMRRVSGSAGLGLSRCPDASGAASTAVERRKASAPEARTDGNIRLRGARRAPLGTAKSVRAFRRSAPLHLFGAIGRAFLKREANLGCQAASRERERVSAPRQWGWKRVRVAV